jgi:hypothetical protein
MDYDKFSTGKSGVALVSTNIVTETTTSGAQIDTKGYNSLVCTIVVTDVTAGYITAVTFQEDDDAAWGTVTTLDDSELLIYDTQFNVTAAGVIRVGCISKKRYVRLRITTETATTVDITAHATYELNDALSAPGQVQSSVLATAEINSPGVTSDSIVTPPKRTS